MSDLIQIASAALLEPAGLQQSDVEGLVGRMMGGAIDYADLIMASVRVPSVERRPVFLIPMNLSCRS